MSQELLLEKTEYNYNTDEYFSYDLGDYDFILNEEDDQENNQIIEGYFPQEDNERQMAIRKLNQTLCILLGIVIMLTVVSYYFATANEMTLNKISKETIAFNDDNAELQNKLDKLKSFNNVDITMQKSNKLTKAKQVIEVPAVKKDTNIGNDDLNEKKMFSWAIGY